jgi:perosamine synthetase
MNAVAFSHPSLSSRERISVAEAVMPETFATDDRLQQFGEAFAKSVGARVAIPVSSKAAALHVVLEALEVGPGDEVIVPELMHASTAAPIRYCGAVPVFVDVDAASWCATAEGVRQAMTPRTKAVIINDLYGIAPDVHRIRAVAHRLGIAVIEDATLAWGHTYLEHQAGTLGDIGIFGFDRTTTLTTGEGGMIVTNHPQAGERLLSRMRFGGAAASQNGGTQHDCRMSAMQAALGLAQLQRADELLEAKQELLSWYRQGLRGATGINLRPNAANQATIQPADCTLLVEPTSQLSAPRLVEQLAARDIEARLLPRPLSSLAAFANLPQAAVGRSRNKQAYQLINSAVVLPSGPAIKREHVAEVCAALKAIVGHRNQQSTRRMAA